MAPLGAALSSGQGMGPIFLGGPMRLPHVVLAVAFDPKLGGGRRVLAPRCRSSGSPTTSRRWPSADTDVALIDARARLIASALARRRRQPRDHPPRPARARARRRPGPSSPNTSATGGASSAPTRRSSPGAWAALVDKTVDAALLPVNRITWATLLWIAVAAFIGSIAARIFARRLSDRVAALVRRLAPDRGREPGDAHRAVRRRRARRAGHRLQPDGRRARGGAPEDHPADRRDQSLEPDAGEAGRGEDGRAARRRRICCSARVRCRRWASWAPAWRTRSTTRSTGALGIVQLLIADLPAGHPARPLLQDLEHEALRIRKIVQNMLRLAQRQSGHDTTPVDLARTLDDAVELCGPSDLAAAGIEVVRKYIAQPRPMRGSATQLQESFIQIIQNARSAMKKGGTLTLETAVIEDKVVRVRIGDTGTGISAEHLPRIFDPFFTTKGDRSGTGLGLSFVHRTVEDHGGAITVREQRGRRHHLHPDVPRRRRAGTPAVTTARPAASSARRCSVAVGLGAIGAAAFVSRRFFDPRPPAPAAAAPAPVAAAAHAPRRRGAVPGDLRDRHGRGAARRSLVADQEGRHADPQRRRAHGGRRARRPAPVGGDRDRAARAGRDRARSAGRAAPPSICAAARWWRASSGSDALAITSRETRTANEGPAHFVVLSDERGPGVGGDAHGQGEVHRRRQDARPPRGDAVVERGRAPRPSDPERIPEEVLLEVVWPAAEQRHGVSETEVAGPRRPVVGGDDQRHAGDGRRRRSLRGHACRCGRGRTRSTSRPRILSGRTRQASATLVRHGAPPALTPETTDLWKK